jgi:hypothetical protein
VNFRSLIELKSTILNIKFQALTLYFMCFNFPIVLTANFRMLKNFSRISGGYEPLNPLKYGPGFIHAFSYS